MCEESRVSLTFPDDACGLSILCAHFPTLHLSSPPLQGKMLTHSWDVGTCTFLCLFLEPAVAFQDAQGVVSLAGQLGGTDLHVPLVLGLGAHGEQVWLLLRH